MLRISKAHARWVRLVLRQTLEVGYRSPMTRDFSAEAALLQHEVNTNADAVYGLRALEESWARDLLGLARSGDITTLVRERVERAFDHAAAKEGLGHLQAAEQWQWRIGSYATGSGEGLASMAEVRALQMASAWLAVALLRETREPALSALATSLAVEVERDPNGMGTKYAKAIVDLRAWLES